MKKNWKMGEIWKIFEFLIWSTRFTDCITALKILKWGFSNIFHVVGNNKTEILSTWSGQKVKMGFLQELPKFSWPICKIHYFQNIFKIHNFGISCPILMIMESKVGFLRSGNRLVMVSHVLHVSYRYQTCVFIHKTGKIEP